MNKKEQVSNYFYALLHQQTDKDTYARQDLDHHKLQPAVDNPQLCNIYFPDFLAMISSPLFVRK